MAIWINAPDKNGDCCDCPPRSSPCDDCCFHDLTVTSGNVIITGGGAGGTVIGNQTPATYHYTATICDACPGGGIWRIYAHTPTACQPLNSNKYPGDTTGPGHMSISVSIGSASYAAAFDGVDAGTVGGLFRGPEQLDGGYEEEVFMPFCDDDTEACDVQADCSNNEDPLTVNGVLSFDIQWQYVGPAP
jgi:hypothetical protein